VPRRGQNPNRPPAPRAATAFGVPRPLAAGLDDLVHVNRCIILSVVPSKRCSNCQSIVIVAWFNSSRHPAGTAILISQHTGTPPNGFVEKVPTDGCGRSCESVSTDLCDLLPLPNMYLRVRSQSRLHGIKTRHYGEKGLSTSPNGWVLKHHGTPPPKSLPHHS
jgi:hypothetical protein